MHDTLILKAARLIKDSKNIAVLTGAGISKESGVPTFRDAMDGLWARFDPQQLATPQAFRANPKLVWDWYEYRRDMVRKAQPNPGHHALAHLEQRHSPVTIITQNVDDLHEQAGSGHIIHLHGSIARNKCFDNCQGANTLIDISTLTWDQENGPPACPYCGGWVRPDVVWFGEMLPPDAIDAAMTASAACDLMIVIGTSGLVTPAANMPSIAKRAGASLIEVNPDDSALTPIMDIKLKGASGVILPQIMDALADG